MSNPIVEHFNLLNRNNIGDCQECVHYTVCQEIERLQQRTQFIWYKAESGCPHFARKSIPVPIANKGKSGQFAPVCGKCGGIMDLLQGELNYCPNCGTEINWEG